MEDKKDSGGNAKVTEAISRYDTAVQAWRHNYTAAKEDLDFLSDDPMAQWDPADYLARTQSGRPALTIDQLGQFVHQVANNIRKNTPSIKIIAGDNGNTKTADIISGLIRYIEYTSGADDAYDTAATSAVKCSIGFARVEHGYFDESTDLQELRIKRIVNPLSVTIDPESMEADGRDMRYAFITDDITVAEFKKRFPKNEVCSFGSDETGRDWEKAGNAEIVRIAEYFYIEETEEFVEGRNSPIKTRKVHRCLLSGKDVLEETTFPGRYIPIVPFYGEEAWINGKRHVYSLIRKSKQAQRMFNYWKSLETELLMKQPQAPIMAAEGQIDDYISDWENPEKSMALRYKTTDLDGNAIPAPQRLTPPMVATGVVNASRQTVDDIKATMGVYGASLGMTTNETSGIAIAKRQDEGDNATFHFGDNTVKSVTQIGRIIVSAIPEVYDSERIVRIIGEDEENKAVGVNGGFTEGQEENYDLTQGRYDVRVVTGASYATKRQESAMIYQELIAKSPDLLTVIGDLLFTAMDFPGSQAVAARLKKLIDPKLLQDDNEGAPDPQVQQLEQALQQAQESMQQMQAQMAEMQKELKSKQMETTAKMQSEQMRAQSEQLKAEIEMSRIHQQMKQADLENEIKIKEVMIKETELEIKREELQLEREKNEIELLAQTMMPKRSDGQSSTS